ncbi:uncharacterized protein LOC126370009 [Pectinophora gossypiella]|uniref:uncharacterized protein LOC126370009 n=1 Tax=Pectinophora gossypiella TaxID=13191 RepID=UPI00214E02D3|nr:uncharacterized protein LOC126370009 [Pectinophora gossypiella]
MASVRWWSVVLSMLVAVAFCFAAQPRAMLWTQVNASQPVRDDIPQQCIDNSVTPVSCAHVTSPDALLPHPDDCQLFYYCVSAAHAPVCRACPAHLHFSPTEHVCDEPQHAGCLLSTTPDPDRTTEEPLSTWDQ